MSQAKVDRYKKEKAERKSIQRRKKILNVVYSLVAVLVIVGIGFLIYKQTRPVYDVNLADTVYDDASLASLIGYNGIGIPDGEASEESGDVSEPIEIAQETVSTEDASEVSE